MKRLFYLLGTFVLLPYSVWGSVPAHVFLVCVSSGSTVGDMPPCSETADHPLSLAVILKTNDRPPKYFGEIQEIKIDGQRKAVRPFPDRDRSQIRWFKVEPVMYHVDGHGHDPANPNFLWYANAGAPGGRTDRQPLPPDTLHYFSTEIKAATPDTWILTADAHPTDSRYDTHQGLGTMRYSVSVSGPGFQLHAPTLENFNPDQGSQERMARISYRENNSYAGYMTGFFNVPGVFGPYDSEIVHHLGVDCSHFVVGAWREYSKKSVPFTNVTGIRTEYVRHHVLDQVAGDHYLDSQGRVYAHYDPVTGQLSEPVQIAVRVGDVITCNYSTDPRRQQWDHVGVIYQERGPQGILNGEDLIINAGPAEPSIDRLAGSEFVAPSQPTRIAVLRWRTTPETR